MLHNKWDFTIYVLQHVSVLPFDGVWKFYTIEKSLCVHAPELRLQFVAFWTLLCLPVWDCMKLLCDVWVSKHFGINVVLVNFSVIWRWRSLVACMCWASLKGVKLSNIVKYHTYTIKQSCSLADSGDRSACLDLCSLESVCHTLEYASTELLTFMSDSSLGGALVHVSMQG